MAQQSMPNSENTASSSMEKSIIELLMQDPKFQKILEEIQKQDIAQNTIAAIQDQASKQFAEQFPEEFAAYMAQLAGEAIPKEGGDSVSTGDTKELLDQFQSAKESGDNDGMRVAFDDITKSGKNNDLIQADPKEGGDSVSTSGDTKELLNQFQSAKESGDNDGMRVAFDDIVKSGKNNDLIGVNAMPPDGAAPEDIAAELERQKDEARIASQLQKDEGALPDTTPQIQQLPGQLPMNAAQEAPADSHTQNESEQESSKPDTDSHRAAELDRQKHEARTNQETSQSTEEEKTDTEENANDESMAEGAANFAKPIPGTRAYLWIALGDCIPAAFAALDFEPLWYIHAHFFGYYLLPDFPWLAIYLGFAKKNFEKPSIIQLCLIALIILLELAIIAIIVFIALLPYIIAFSSLDIFSDLVIPDDLKSYFEDSKDIIQQ